jgi:SIR2-like protein
VAQQGRKILFVLGAGASVGAGAFAQVQGAGRIPIPTQTTFWPTFLRFSAGKANRRTIESFLFRYFLGYGKAPSRLKPAKRWALLREVDVEEVFTFVSERVRAPATSAQLRTYFEAVWEALVTEIPIVFGRFRPNAGTRLTFRTLLQQHLRSRDVVVSFNYDTLFEHSLPGNRPWHYAGLTDSTNELRILKPHGSVNWAAPETPQGEITVVSQPARSVVVAPTHLKFVETANAANSVSLTPAKTTSSGYLDQSRQIQQVWAEMEKEMRQSKALIFVGYSFPVADLYFSSVLRSVLAVRDATPALVIVNPDAVAIRERLHARFPIDKVLLYYDLATFLQITRKQLLRQIERAETT